MRRAFLLLLLTACGRYQFDALAADASAADATTDVLTPYPWVARYPMDDDPATGMITAVPASYSVPCTTCPAAITGRLDGGYAFNGAIQIPLRHPALIGAAPFTVAVWVRLNPSSTANLEVLLAKPSTSPSVLNVLSLEVFANTGEILWESSDSSQMVRSIGSARDLRGAWHHVVTRWDGVMRDLIVDGVVLGTDQLVFPSSSLDVYLGADMDDGSVVYFYTGDLDDLRFYDRALDAAELTALANP